MKELDTLKKDDNFATNYNRGMSHLLQSGVFNVLRQIGRCGNWNEKTSIEHVALNGAWSRGYQDCLDTLFNFVEKFIQPEIDTTQVRMDFGGLNRAIEKELLTEEEADAIRRGETVNINPKLPKSPAAH